MALQKETIYKGLTAPKAYYKIAEVKYISNFNTPVNEDGKKLFEVDLAVYFFDNENKENLLDIKGYHITKATEDMLNLPSFYNYLKNLDEFKDAKDV